MAAAVAVVGASCTADTAGERCQGNGDCDEHQTCWNEVCARELYAACFASDECGPDSSCAMGYCTRPCSQLFTAGTYALGDCVEGAACDDERGVGCCKITKVERADAQDLISGFCTAAP